MFSLRKPHGLIERRALNAKKPRMTARLLCVQNREELFWAVEGFEGEGGGDATGKIGQDIDA